MSKIALSGPASGTATYTISAPTGATDRTITLPDQTATLITNSSGVLDIGSGQLYKDASGNLGIGTSSPQGKLDVTGTGDTLALVTTNTSGNPRLGLLANGVVYNWIQTNRSDSSMQFAVGNTERARIDSSGNLLVGTTSASCGGVTVTQHISASDFCLGLTATGGGASRQVVRFSYSTTAVGSITVGASSTSYNTSSDYRLKENIAPMTGALAKVAALNPVTYTWKADGSDGQGFIAHELAEVVPDCVTGEKDAVDADGNPQYQGIDTSFLVATLTAAIQEQQAIITALTARVTALEGTQP